MLGPVGQRRALSGVARSDPGDVVVLLHRDTELVRWPPDVGYPRLDDRDSGNPGRGERVVTWRVTIPESIALGNAVTHARVVDTAGLSIMHSEFEVPVRKVVGKALLAYVNLHIR